MYRVFNMGIAFCWIVPDDLKVLGAVEKTFAAHRLDTRRIGKVVADERRRVFLPKHDLIGEGDEFRRA
jgi:phosphoribosylaminoimidazole (AIR) synthetase